MIIHCFLLSFSIMSIPRAPLRSTADVTIPRLTLEDTVDRVHEVLEDVMSQVNIVVSDQDTVEADVKEVISEIRAIKNFFQTWKLGNDLAKVVIRPSNSSNSTTTSMVPFVVEEETSDLAWVGAWIWLSMITCLVRIHSLKLGIESNSCISFQLLSGGLEVSLPFHKRLGSLLQKLTWMFFGPMFVLVICLVRIIELLCCLCCKKKAYFQKFDEHPDRVPFNELCGYETKPIPANPDLKVLAELNAKLLKKELPLLIQFSYE